MTEQRGAAMPSEMIRWEGMERQMTRKWIGPLKLQSTLASYRLAHFSKVSKGMHNPSTPRAFSISIFGYEDPEPRAASSGTMYRDFGLATQNSQEDQGCQLYGAVAPSDRCKPYSSHLAPSGFSRNPVTDELDRN